MEAILIFRQPDVNETKVIEDKLHKSLCIAVAAPGLQIADSLNFAEPLPAGITRQANRHLLNSILAFGDRDAGNETLSELLNAGNFPIWHYQRFRIYYNLQPLFVLREATEHYQKQGYHITVYCDSGSVSSLNGLEKPVYIIAGPKQKKAKLNTAALLNYIIYFIIKVLSGLLFPPDYTNKKHLLVDRSVRQLCRHPETLKLKFDNYTLSNLFDSAGDDFLYITEHEPPKVKGNGSFKLKANLFLNHRRDSGRISGEYILTRGLFSPGLIRERKRMVADLELKIRQADALKLTGQEVMIFNAFKKLAPTNSYFITRFLAYQRFFRKHDFLTVAAIDENSPSTRCILDAARSTGVKTIGIQHGNIGDAQPAYLYTENDRKNRVMADFTLVWGDYWRDFLINKGNFPSDSVFVTGQIRTDIIPKLMAVPDIFKKEMVIRKPVVVFASQPIPDPVIRRKAATDVFSAFSKLAGYELIVKLHPAEKDAIDYYHEIAAQTGCKDYRLMYNVDLYSLLAAADLVITCYSTVGTEAVYFGKPLIILDYMKEDLLGYHAAGVAWQAMGTADLIRFAEGVLEGKLKPDQESLKRFIEKYAFRIDGRVTERTLSFIRAVKSGTFR
ncbi:MAG: hypothetical protein V1775_15060 [Bacteroidota bacterium]